MVLTDFAAGQMEWCHIPLIVFKVRRIDGRNLPTGDFTLFFVFYYFYFIFKVSYGRRGGLMVSVLDSGSGCPGSSPGRGTALCSWARYFTPIVPLSTRVAHYLSERVTSLVLKTIDNRS